MLKLSFSVTDVFMVLGDAQSEAVVTAREGSLMGAARALAIDRNTLKRKLRHLGLR